MSLIRHLTRIHFGEEVVEEALAAELARHGVCRPLLLAGFGRAEAALVAMLAAAPPRATVRPVVVPPPAGNDLATTRRLAEGARAAGCDAVVAAGGRRILELAKLVALLAVEPEPNCSALGEAAAAVDRGRPGLPLVAIATTAGAGAEVTAEATILLGEGRPCRLGGDRLLPAAAILDPICLDPREPVETAAGAFEALARCVEAFAAPGYNPPADAVALDGIERIVAALPRALDHPRDLAARRELLAGALAGGLASQKGQGGIEALLRAIQSLEAPRALPGAVVAALMPHLLVFNAKALGARRGALARALTGSAEADPAEAVARLAERAGLGRGLAALGLGPEIVDRAAPHAEADPASGTNPRRIAAAHYRALLKAAA
ncbi:MAG: iron-containing alcohol dehydrogenase [Geminicoccaceae bacterium]|nr:iron-containing alcohol dehydrogenase [Geminicoccaceae bacterium]